MLASTFQSMTPTPAELIIICSSGTAIFAVDEQQALERLLFSKTAAKMAVKAAPIWYDRPFVSCKKKDFLHQIDKIIVYLRQNVDINETNYIDWR